MANISGLIAVLVVIFVWAKNASTANHIIGKVDGMNASEYQQLAKRTLIDRPDFDLLDKDVMTIWNAIGLAGEAGEIAELVKKGIFHQHGLDVGKLSKEIGDCLWYLAALCTKLDLDMGAIMADNIAKLEVRYPDGFNSADSVKRVDVK